MNWVSVFLWLNGLTFVGYGLACLGMPSLPAHYAGLELATPSGTVEVMAMYGGLQTGFGLLLIVGARDVGRRGTILLALAVVAGGLASARLLGIAFVGPSDYNLGALVYESLTALLAVAALRGARKAEAAA
jgi:hypothetical protein